MVSPRSTSPGGPLFSGHDLAQSVQFRGSFLQRGGAMKHKEKLENYDQILGGSPAIGTF
jgi:hypothetical protein